MSIEEKSMNRRILTLSLVFVLSACARPAPPTPTSPPPVTVAPPTLSAPVVAAPAFTAIHMNTEQAGWAITDTGVVKTDDGGKTWHDATPPGVTSLGYAVSFDFLDLKHGWVLVGGSGGDPK